MVRKKKLIVNVDVKQNDMLRTLNFSFQGQPQDRLRMIPSLRQAVSPMKVPCVALFDNVLSVILTKDMGTSEDHSTFIDEVTRLAGDALGYKAGDVDVHYSVVLDQFISDLATQEQQSRADLITMPDWDTDQMLPRHLRALN